MSLIRVHKEGVRIILALLTALLAINLTLYYTIPTAETTLWVVFGVSALFFLFIVSFFRNPVRRVHTLDDSMIYAPADGRIVVVEEVEETEYFNDKRLQVSIFMSPANVHVNRNPISGTVNYFKYHPGRYLVAWNPKSSTENERTSVVIQNGDSEILLRQIAGLMAKRIVNYLDEGEEVVQGSDMGFIKFGSRVDLFLPISAKVQVKLNQKVKGNRTVIALLD